MKKDAESKRSDLLFGFTVAGAAVVLILFIVVNSYLRVVVDSSETAGIVINTDYLQQTSGVVINGTGSIGTSTSTKITTSLGTFLVHGAVNFQKGSELWLETRKGKSQYLCNYSQNKKICASLEG